jgi:GNAT superfamily N-acetyltransferase
VVRHALHDLLTSFTNAFVSPVVALSTTGSCSLVLHGSLHVTLDSFRDRSGRSVAVLVRPAVPLVPFARWVAFAPFFVLMCCLAYAWALVQAPSAGSTFADVLRFFSSEWGAVTVWLHVVVVDFFAGVFVARDARRLGVSAWLVAPLLVVTLFFAPLGVAAWLLLRGVWKREWRLDVG